MNESRDNTAQGPDHPGLSFRDLIDRPTPELDPQRLWRRIEARVPDNALPSPRISSRPVWWLSPRLAWGAAAIVVVSLALWAVSAGRAPTGAPQIVVLAPTESQASAAEPPTALQPLADESAGAVSDAVSDAPLHLDVRLVRGYDGVPPSDVSVPEPAGTGGADALRDARASIAGLLPFESFGLVGGAQVTLAGDAALEIVLSGDYRLLTRSVETSAPPQQTVILEGLELVGGGQESMPADLTLEPGRLYILGVLAAGADDPELVLLIRARARRGGE